MDLNKAHTLAIKLMSKYKLIEQGWRFEFDGAVKRFGVCRTSRRIIGLSRHLVEVNDEERVKDTILHEIAHALTPGQGHNWVWKRKCVEVGCKPERCYTSEDTTLVELKYKAICGSCGKKHQRARKPREGRRFSCICQSGMDWNKRVLLEFR